MNTGMLHQLNQMQPSRCECHECTQARYKQSIQYQLDQTRQWQELAEATKAWKESACKSLDEVAKPE